MDLIAERHSMARTKHRPSRNGRGYSEGETVMLTGKCPEMSDEESWKLRFRTANILGTQVACQVRTRGLVTHNKSGTYQHYAWDIPTGNMRQLTSRPEGAGFQAYISPDGRYVYYLDDKQGNEIGHYVRVAFEGGDPQDITPNLPPYSSLAGSPCFSISRDGNLIGFTADSKTGFHLYCIDVSSEGILGEPRPLRSSKKLAGGPFLSRDGKIAFWASSERSEKPQFSFLALDTKTGREISELWDGPGSGLDYELSVVSPVHGDPRILTATNRTGIERLLVWNPITKERQDLEAGMLAGSMRAFDWSPSGRRILFRTYNNAAQQLYEYGLADGEIRKLNHPPGTNSGPYFCDDNEIWSHWQSFTNAPCLIALDAETGGMRRVVLRAGEPPSGRELQSFTFVSSDGQVVQGWLGTPEGRGPFPTVLETHGGPESVTSNTYLPDGQTWIDQGFAYASINYRGSITFGREFQEKIWGKPGYWEVEDMVAARDWLVREGVARPDMVLVTGWSYGGYLTLQALGKRPALWAGGMAGIAIADWTTLYDDASDTIKAWAAALLGGTPQQKPEQYAESSPITYAANVRAPVLVIQGRNDTRTPARPVEKYEARLKELRKPIEVHWFDAGHLGSFLQTDRRIEHQELMLRFAQKVVSGSSNA
jgi:dienelactone hydrolase